MQNIHPRKILLCTHSPEERESLKKALSSFEVEVAQDGVECLNKISSYGPSLLLVDLMLPKMHAIELIRKIRELQKPIGVVLMLDQPMIQAYDAAKNLHVDEFLIRPFSSEKIKEVCDLYFKGQLKLSPLSDIDYHPEGGHCYIPKIHNPDHYLKFWGTRGSSAVSGSDYVRYGGNSSCLEIRAGDDLVIIDAGTGIRPLGELLIGNQARNIHLFLGHTHWDHVTGFPFFGPLYDPNVRLSIWAPVGFGLDTRELFIKMLAYAFFPVRLDDIRARIEFHDLRDGDHVSIGDLSIATHYAFHPGSTLCFRITRGNYSCGYVTDNEFLRGYHGHPGAIDRNHPLLNPYQSQIEFLQKVDLLIHEAQYTPFEYQDHTGWGHSSISNASVLIKHAQAKDWIVTHHDPKHTDLQLSKKLQLHRDILEDCHINCRVMMAYDGLSIPF